MTDRADEAPLRVLLGVSGGIAAYKSADLVRRLRGRGHEVRCALTRAATAFVTPLTLEVLSGNAVHLEEYLAPTPPPLPAPPGEPPAADRPAAGGAEAGSGAGESADWPARPAGDGEMGRRSETLDGDSEASGRTAGPAGETDSCGRPVRQPGEEAHITAALWADVLCIAPATAHVLARLALGLADDFLTTTALAHRGPVVAAPAMHTAMWQQPATQEHVAVLRRRGVRLVGPVEGPLASGESGMGRMADPDAIVQEIEDAAGRNLMRGLRVVVSAGPTHEPVDPVRYLGNRSSGKMGFALAAAAARRGARVTLVAGPVALATPPGVARTDVGTAREMERAMRDAASAAGGADLVIMAAAVADLRPRHPAAAKLKKSRGLPRTLELEENPDILAGLRAVAPAAVLAGFAAETEELEANARAKLAAKNADFLVANDVSRHDIAFGSDANEVTVFRRGQTPPVFLERRPKQELAAALLDLFTAAVRERARRQPAAAATVPAAR